MTAQDIIDTQDKLLIRIYNCILDLEKENEGNEPFLLACRLIRQREIWGNMSMGCYIRVPSSLADR